MSEFNPCTLCMPIHILPCPSNVTWPDAKKIWQQLKLRRQLKAFGEDVGPVTLTTRSPLLRKLKRLQNEHKESQPPQNKIDFAPSSFQGAPQSGTPSKILKITARNLPFLVVLWFGITSVVCIVDASFVLLRPHTPPGENGTTFSNHVSNRHMHGKLEKLIERLQAKLHLSNLAAQTHHLIVDLIDNIYIQIDTGYKDLKDAFVIGQSWMNLVEVLLNIITVIMYIIGKTGQSVLLAFMVSTMTFSKTVLFILISSGLCGGHTHVNLDDWKRTVYFYILPNGIWIVVPLLCMVATGNILLDCMKNYEVHEETKKLKLR